MAPAPKAPPLRGSIAEADDADDDDDGFVAELDNPYLVRSSVEEEVVEEAEEEVPMEEEAGESEEVPMEEEAGFDEHYAAAWAADDDPYDDVVAPEVGEDGVVGEEWAEEEAIDGWAPAEEGNEASGSGGPEAEIVEEPWEVEVEGGRPDWTEVKATRVAQGYAPRGGVRTKLSSLVLAVLDGPLMSNRGGETAADMAKSFLDGDDRVFADVERMRRTAHWRQDRR
jgi:hypothetical protein